MKLCEFKDDLIKKKIDDNLNASNDWKVVNKNKRDPGNYTSNSSKSTSQSSGKADFPFNIKYKNNTSNLSNQNYSYNHRKDTSSSYKNSFLNNNKNFKKNKKENFANYTNNKINSDSTTATNNIAEDEVDDYFNAALNIENSQTTDTNEESDGKDKKSKLLKNDIKELVEEIKKNKDFIQRRRNESFTLSSTTEITIPSNVTVDVLPVPPVIDENLTESVNENLTLNKNSSKDNEITQNTLNNLEVNKENDGNYEFEFSKIPTNNFLNANNYNNYFFENNPPKKNTLKISYPNPNQVQEVQFSNTTNVF